MAIDQQQATSDDNTPSVGVISLPQALGAHIDFVPTVESLRSLIVASEDFIEENCALPPDLVEAMHEAGIPYALHPREFGGREMHPVDWLDLIFALSRINASVGWVAMIQSGVAALLEPSLMEELYEKAGGRYVVSGSHGRVGKAYPVEGGYNFTGEWVFASGGPWATYITAYADVMGPDGKPLKDPFSDGPMRIDGIFPKDEVEWLGRWNPFGLRGTASGMFRLENVFVERRFTTGMLAHEHYHDRALYNGATPDGTGMVILGAAQGAIDAVVALTRRTKLPYSYANRQALLGKEQLHQVDLASADSLVKSARNQLRDVMARVLENTPSTDAQLSYELAVENMQSSIHAGRAAKQAVNLVFDMAGTDSVIRGRGIERCLRDAYTGAQHELIVEQRNQPVGQYYFTRDDPDGAKVDPGSMLGPPPRVGDAARKWELDPLHSTVRFTVRHHAVSNFRADFTEFSARYDDESGNLEGSLKLDSLRTFEMLRDHLLADDFLAANRFPDATFQSTGLSVDGEQIEVQGELTLRGITQPVTATGTVTAPSRDRGFGSDQEFIGVDVTTTIDRREFGMDYNNELLDGQLNLGWAVTLEFSLEFSRPAAD